MIILLVGISSQSNGRVLILNYRCVCKNYSETITLGKLTVQCFAEAKMAKIDSL